MHRNYSVKRRKIAGEPIKHEKNARNAAAKMCNKKRFIYFQFRAEKFQRQSRYFMEMNGIRGSIATHKIRIACWLVHVFAFIVELKSNKKLCQQNRNTFRGAQLGCQYKLWNEYFPISLRIILHCWFFSSSFIYQSLESLISSHTLCEFPSLPTGKRMWKF